MKLFPLYHISPLLPKLFDSFLLKSRPHPFFLSQKFPASQKSKEASVDANASRRKEVECPNLYMAMGIKTVFILPHPKKKRKALCAKLLTLRPHLLPSGSSPFLFSGVVRGVTVAIFTNTGTRWVPGKNICLHEIRPNEKIKDQDAGKHRKSTTLSDIFRPSGLTFTAHPVYSLKYSSVLFMFDHISLLIKYQSCTRFRAFLLNAAICLL